MSQSLPAATSLTTAELTWLLSLRPGPSAALVATALGVSDESDASTIAGMVHDGRALQRGGEVLPAGPDAAIGDVLTAADALVRLGTADALAALLAIGRDRVLLLVPTGQGSVEVAALDSATHVGEAVGEIASRIGAAAMVTVARPAGEVREVAVDAGLGDVVEELLR